MKTDTEETVIPGELKRFEVDRDFLFRGESFKKGETLEVSAEDARQLMSLRVPFTDEDSKSKRYGYAGRMIGSYSTVERQSDGAHKLSFWHKSYSESDDWVLVEFLEDVHGWGVKVGNRRRLRRSDARDMEHTYINSPAPSPNQAPRLHPARILILEPRPRASMTQEESLARQAAVMAGQKNTDGWVSSITRL
jgi:hypothetical protein